MKSQAPVKHPEALVLVSSRKILNYHLGRVSREDRYN